jgi:hypothetical protein
MVEHMVFKTMGNKIVNSFYSEMVNWAKQDMVFKNHEKQSINGFLKPRA